MIQGGDGNATITAADLTGDSISIHLGNGVHTIRLGDGDDSIVLGDGKTQSSREMAGIWS